ncbi:MAG: 4'-phosphopantetheinyl transferase superfamily protein [Salibacteraceae bacterium]
MNSLILHKFTPNQGAEIIIARIGKVIEQLNPVQLNAYEGNYSLERKAQLACADALVSDYFKSDVVIQRNASGAPSLVGSELHISISHTYDFMAIYLSEKGPVAIDIELLGRDIERIKHRFTTEEEVAAFEALNFSEPLLQVWGLKECLFKVIPTNKVLFKNHLFTKRPQQKNDRVICDGEVRHPHFNADYSMVSCIFEPLIVSYISMDRP